MYNISQEVGNPLYNIKDNTLSCVAFKPQRTAVQTHCGCRMSPQRGNRILDATQLRVIKIENKMNIIKTTNQTQWMIVNDKQERIFNRDFNSISEAESFIERLTEQQKENVR